MKFFIKFSKNSNQSISLTLTLTLTLTFLTIFNFNFNSNITFAMGDAVPSIVNVLDTLNKGAVPTVVQDCHFPPVPFQSSVESKEILSRDLLTQHEGTVAKMNNGNCSKQEENTDYEEIYQTILEWNEEEANDDVNKEVARNKHDLKVVLNSTLLSILAINFEEGIPLGKDHPLVELFGQHPLYKIAWPFLDEAAKVNMVKIQLTKFKKDETHGLNYRLTCDSDGDITGITMYREQDDHIFVKYLAASPAAPKGAGTAAIMDIVGTFKKNIKLIPIVTAKPFYGKTGFTDCEDMQMCLPY